MTTFTYEEITSATEQVIKMQVESSQKTSTNALREMHLNFASGALFNWHWLTSGKQSPGDYDRLRNMIVEDEECPF